MIEGIERPKFLTVEVAAEAVQRVILPLFEGDNIVMKRRMAHIVVIVPERRGRHIVPLVLYEHSIGTNWPWEFGKIARSKAFQLWEDRNGDQTDIMPHLLYRGDSPFWGGVKRHGIVVSCSGVEPWFDRMIAGMVLEAIVGLAYHAWMQSEDRSNDVSFIV